MDEMSKRIKGAWQYVQCLRLPELMISNGGEVKAAAIRSSHAVPGTASDINPVR
jgi:hypothetical protein